MLSLTIPKVSQQLLYLTALGILLTTRLIAQSGPTRVFAPDEHIGFDRPEAWGLKYFASASLLSGLQPPEAPEGYRTGSVNIGFEIGWIPALDAGQQLIGFNGTSPEDLNKAPVFPRLVVRVGLPNKFSFVAAAPPPLHVFGVTSHLFAMGLERPLVIRPAWTFSWRGYGQVGSVKGAFTCPGSVLAFTPGSAGNPTACVSESADAASLRYLGSELQFAYRLRRTPKLSPHLAVGGNFLDGVFHTHAHELSVLDETRLWTHGGTLSTTGGVSYALTQRAAFTVDVFYSPLAVKRNATAPVTNDGLFNVRALISYSFR
ncbi:MAG: hypothetical protein JOY53_14880 [Acidobacteriaceae bacterium]|nr:hypothetical protein [Acidobacteriaceae bacterium]